MKIQSKVPTKEYKENYERIFGNKVETTKRQEQGKESPETSSGPNSSNKS